MGPVGHPEAERLAVTTDGPVSAATTLTWDLSATQEPKGPPDRPVSAANVLTWDLSAIQRPISHPKSAWNFFLKNISAIFV